MRRPRSAHHQAMRAFYRRLLELRAAHHLGSDAWQHRQVEQHEAAAAITMVTPDVALVLGFADDARTLSWQPPAGQWCRKLSSRAPAWQGPGDELPEQLTGSQTVQLRLPGPIALFYARAR
jgi:hypothetical protein